MKPDLSLLPWQCHHELILTWLLWNLHDRTNHLPWTLNISGLCLQIAAGWPDRFCGDRRPIWKRLSKPDLTFAFLNLRASSRAILDSSERRVLNRALLVFQIRQTVMFENIAPTIRAYSRLLKPRLEAFLMENMPAGNFNYLVTFFGCD